MKTIAENPDLDSVVSALKDIASHVLNSANIR